MEWDYLIVGSGFGGSASGLRLSEKGYRVLLLEKGERLDAPDFPKTNWSLKQWLWLPALGFRGLFKMTFLRHVTALSGVGVGGGSLVYASTMPLPPQSAFDQGSWAGLADWQRELAPHYDTAKRMMGVAKNPYVTRADDVLREIAVEMERGDHARPADVAVHFGTPGLTVVDPYFDGEGPTRTGCIQCGACMTGCKHNAKNTLDKNYLHLAEKRGLKIDKNTEVVSIRPLSGGNGYEVIATMRISWKRSRERVFRCRNVILSGGVLGTVDLLARMKEPGGTLPALSARLGYG
jgi:cholesterol oxidase